MFGNFYLIHILAILIIGLAVYKTKGSKLTVILLIFSILLFILRILF